MNVRARSNLPVPSKKSTMSISCEGKSREGKSINIRFESNLPVPDDKNTICIFCREKLTEETRCQRKNFKSVCKECFGEFFELLKILKNSPDPDTDNLTPEQIHFAVNLFNVTNLGVNTKNFITKEERQENIKQAKKLSKGKLREAKVEDYKSWLIGFLKNNGELTHNHDFPMSCSADKWRVAFKNFRTAKLLGSDSFNIIVLKGVKFLGGELGENSLYFMKDFSHMNTQSIPIFSDIHL